MKQSERLQAGCGLIVLGIVVMVFGLACGPAPTPTPTPDPNAGRSIMQAMPCEELLRYADAAILRAEDAGGWGYDGMTDLTLLINRIEGQQPPTIMVDDVSDRLDECEPPE